jgi:hypothetical protein
MDIDDYINSLIRENESLKNTVASLKLEVRTQRKEIAVLREEQKILFDADKGPYIVNLTQIEKDIEQ